MWSCGILIFHKQVLVIYKYQIPSLNALVIWLANVKTVPISVIMAKSEAHIAINEAIIIIVS